MVYQVASLTPLLRSKNPQQVIGFEVAFGRGAGVGFLGGFEAAFLRVLGEKRKGKDVEEVRTIFEETFDVVHGDEGGGWG